MDSRPTTTPGVQAPMEESVGSNSPPPSPARRPRRPPNPAQQLADRIDRAFHHRLRLLHRSGSAFFVLGATGNVYTVTLSTAPPSCTCPDRAATPCKHTLFVLLRVLGLPPDAACIRRRASLRPPHLRHLLDAPTPSEALAGSRARERFHQLFSSVPSEGGAQQRNDRTSEPGGTCPVCLEEMEEEEEEEGGVATCAACGNSVHEQCFQRWKRIRGRRAASCVMCRARWRERKEQETYVNLAAYASEDDAAAAAAGGRAFCAG